TRYRDRLPIIICSQSMKTTFFHAIIEKVKRGHHTMLKRITTLGWLMIAMIVFLVLTGMNHLTHDKPKQAANQFERETEVHPKEKIPSQYPDIHILLETKVTDAYNLYIKTHINNRDVLNTNIIYCID